MQRRSMITRVFCTHICVTRCVASGRRWLLLGRGAGLLRRRGLLGCVVFCRHSASIAAAAKNERSVDATTLARHNMFGAT